MNPLPENFYPCDRIFWKSLFLVFLILSLPFLAQAKSKTSPNSKPVSTFDWTFSVGSWISTGETDSNHTSSSILFGDPTSELTFQDLTGYTGELEIQVRRKRLFARALIGYGGGSGELLDDDYLSAFGASLIGTSQSGEHRFSRTLHDVDVEDMLYTQLDAGGYFFQNRRLRMGAYIGYQFWAEEYQAMGVTQLECTSTLICFSPGTLSNTGQKVITNTIEWHSMRMGFDLSYKPFKRWYLDLDLAFIPLAFVGNDDIHHLRTDLAQSPSTEDSGQGLGLTFEGMVRYHLFPNFFIKAGYRLWHLQSDNGTTVFYFSSGNSSKTVLNDFNSFRHGGVLSLEYRY